MNTACQLDTSHVPLKSGIVVGGEGFEPPTPTV